MTKFNYDLSKVSKMTDFNYNLSKVSKMIMTMTCLKSAKCVCAFYGLKLLSIFKIDIHRE